MEVNENIKLVNYDTLWYNIWDITGIDKIKMLTKEEILEKNPHEVYINESENIFEPKYNTVAFVKTSRQFDIELKDFVYYKKTEAGYEEVIIQIPMFFVQRPNLETYEQDAFTENKNNGLAKALVNSLSEAHDKAILDAYNDLLPAYDIHEQLNTKEIIEDYILN